PISGPAGQQGYPENVNNVIEFAEGAEKQSESFKNCAGFLLYENSASNKDFKGAKTIYARGIIDSNQDNLGIKPKAIEDGKRWTSGVRVILEKRVDPKEGISLNKIKELTGVGNNMQRRGGLLSISEDQFKKLEKMLESL
ncbi:hypothetical protein KKA72_01375, partial [Patescibacteria group bacterium]|nr:hypothetical protein [Patescibacteria group bacterium]